MFNRGIYEVGRILGVNKKYFTEKEDENGILIRIAIPGVSDTSTLKVTITFNKIKVHFSGNAFCEPFLYTYPIYEKYNKEDSYAEVEDGVLEIFIPKNLDNQK